MRAAARRVCGVVVGLWSATCIVTLLALIGARWLRYTSWSSAPWLDEPLGRFMIFVNQAFLWLWAYGQVELPTVALAVTVVLLARHRRAPATLLVRRDGALGLAPLPTAFVLSGMLAVHYMFDVNPMVAGGCALSLALATALGDRRLAARVPPTPLPALWIAFFAVWLVLAGDWFDRAAITAWGAGLLLTHWAAPYVAARDLTLVRAIGVIPANLLPALLPLVVPPPGGVHLGDGLAYAFCEVPGRATLWASIPDCGSVETDNYEACKNGRIVEYDVAARKQVAEHRFFSPSFYGRLELMACLADEVYVGVQASVYQEKEMKQSVMAFSVADPTRFTPVAAGRALGVTFTYDALHDAMFYTGEFTNLLVRYDRRTRQFDDTPSQDLVRPWHQPVTLEAYGGTYQLAPDVIHPGRNRLYVTEWMGGSAAHAIDLTSLRVVASYPHRSGAGLGLSVDPGRDRLFISSLWGLEVFDLKTDTLVLRKRIGLGNRPVIVDAPRNRLYVSSMVEGKVRVLDRDTLEVIGQIPIGLGSRYPHLSRDGKWLAASSVAAHYVFDPDRI